MTEERNQNELILHFGTSFDSKVHFDYFDRSELNTKDVVVGPLGLISWLELQLGLSVKECSDQDRLSGYKEAVSNVLGKQEDSFCSKSFELDPVGTSKVLLELRDEALLCGWRPEKDAIPVRFELLKLIEGESVLPGFSDRIQRLLRTDRVNLGWKVVIYHNPEELHPIWNQVFDWLEDTGCELEFTKLKTNARNGSDLSNLVSLLKGEIETFEAQGDGSVLFVYGDSEDVLSQRLLELIEVNSEVVVDHSNSLVLDQHIIRSGGDTLGVMHRKSNSEIMRLPATMMCLLSETPDIRSLYQLTKQSCSCFSNLTKGFLRKKIEKKPGVDISWWKEELKSHGEPSNATKILEEIERWFIDPSWINNENAWSTTSIKAFYQQAFGNGFLSGEKDPKHFKRNNNNAGEIDALRMAINHLLTELELSNGTLSETQLDTLCNHVAIVSSTRLTENGALAPRAITSPAEVLSGATSLVWWNFGDGIAPQIHNPFFADEKKWLDENGIGTYSGQLQCADWISQVQRGLGNISERVVFVNPKSISGEIVRSNVILDLTDKMITDNDKLKVKLSSSSTNEWVEKLNSNTKKVQPQYSLQRINAVNSWKIKNVDKIQLRKVESFTSINLALQYPHEYFLQHLSDIKSSGTIDFENIFRVKGLVAHKVVELMVKDHSFLEQVEFQESLQNHLEYAVKTEGAILLDSLYQLDYQDLKKTLQENIPKLRDLVLNSAVPNPRIEVERGFSGIPFNSSVKLKGDIDFLIYSGEATQPSAIIDIKYAGRTKRQKEIQENADYQLAIYAHFLSDSNIPRAYFLVVDGLLITSDEDIFIGAVIKNRDGRKADIIRILKNSFNKRMEQFKSGEIEVGIGEELSALDFWSSDEDVIIPDPDWPETKKGVNKYGAYGAFVNTKA